MKRAFVIQLLLVTGLQFTVAQQIITTTHKSTCTYQVSTSSLQGCVEENQAVVFTFQENTKVFTQLIGGITSIFAIESRTFQAPLWTYRINDGEGVMYDLKINQSTREYYFYPISLTDGSVVNWYH